MKVVDRRKNEIELSFGYKIEDSNITLTQRDVIVKKNMVYFLGDRFCR